MKSAFRLAALSLALMIGTAPPGLAREPAASVTIEAKPAGKWTAGAMVAAANPLAVEAGLAVLRKGGTAIDAAIAVQAVLGLVEPQSSGLGGGAFLVYYNAKDGNVTAYDGRENAPAGATPDMFLESDGKPMGFIKAVQSGRSVGVPGAVGMLLMAHKDAGKLDLPTLVAPAVKLAEDGFPVSQRLHNLIGFALKYNLSDEAKAYLTTDGTTPLAVGAVLKNQAYADSLKTIAAEGADGFYEGPLAQAMVDAAHRGAIPGTLALSDLKAYQPRRLEPVCGPYRDDLVCGMPSPSSGGIAVVAALGMLQHFDEAKAGPTPEGYGLLVEAERLAYADRDLYVADDRFEKVPTAGLIDPDYLAGRAKLITPGKAITDVEPGVPPGAPEKHASDTTGGWTGTSHIVIVDNDGNVVSMTTTVESVFGSQRMAGGFFMNNQLTDFSFAPTDDKGLPIANAVAAGKKPRSSMAPTIVFHDGHFKMAVGSAGGNAIIAYVLKTMVGMLDWGMSPEDAMALPNIVARGKVIVEPSFDKGLMAALAAMGETISVSGADEVSGLTAIMMDGQGHLVGGADPRREGVARQP